ncbi:hypothetical protein AB6A40_008833 [Gnathostoma spinigerum]|uniref:Uncharacterized protein n=1 Tax=Gnathostoma spinigerum TaxID=75299 RepID=A0ABD6EQ76_9BILA
MMSTSSSTASELFLAALAQLQQQSSTITVNVMSPPDDELRSPSHGEDECNSSSTPLSTTNSQYPPESSSPHSSSHCSVSPASLLTAESLQDIPVSLVMPTSRPSPIDIVNEESRPIKPPVPNNKRRRKPDGQLLQQQQKKDLPFILYFIISDGRIPLAITIFLASVLRF